MKTQLTVPQSAPGLAGPPKELEFCSGYNRAIEEFQSCLILFDLHTTLHKSWYPYSYLCRKENTCDIFTSLIFILYIYFIDV